VNIGPPLMEQGINLQNSFTLKSEPEDTTDWSKPTMTSMLTIPYPENFPDALGETKHEFEEEAKWSMAVKLFERRRLSSGMAATLVGVDRVTFLLRLQEFGVAMIDLSEDEILSDLANA